jgi:pimeloyl-ACP methyl ester carboxylesterase
VRPTATILSVVALLIGAGGAFAGRSHASAVEPPPRVLTAGPVITTLYAVKDPVGLMVTSGGWAYCEQIRALARRTRYALLCGRYAKDGYLGPGLRSERHLDWGDPEYLARFAKRIAAVHQTVGGRLILIGVSYSGFGVATLASHHPELHPNRVIVIDSYLDLVARRRQLPDAQETAREIDSETGGSEAALRQRSVSADGLARLVRGGTDLTVIWSVSADEQRTFRGATCNRAANAATLAQLAQKLRRPVAAWVTKNRHGHDLWDHGAQIIRGSNPGREVVFPADGRIPMSSVCGG